MAPPQTGPFYCKLICSAGPRKISPREGMGDASQMKKTIDAYKLLKQAERTNKLLELISDQLELQYLEQFVAEEEPDSTRVAERDYIRSRVFEKRTALKLE